MEVTNNKGESFELTKDEEKFLRAIKRLEKLDPGRFFLFGSGQLTLRFEGISQYRVVYSPRISCEGGDGGDNFD